MKKPNAVMIDLETLDTEPSTVVLSIGAVFFNDTYRPDFSSGLPGDEGFYQELMLVDQLNDGRTISASTTEWWIKENSQEIGRLIIEEKFGVEFELALKILFDQIAAAGPVAVWANSPAFDLAILRHAAELYNLKVPWEYYHERDYRTLRKMSWSVIKYPKKYLETFSAHDALADAHHQALGVQMVTRKLAKVLQ